MDKAIAIFQTVLDLIKGNLVTIVAILGAVASVIGIVKGINAFAVWWNRPEKKLKRAKKLVAKGLLKQADKIAKRLLEQADKIAKDLSRNYEGRKDIEPDANVIIVKVSINKKDLDYAEDLAWNTIYGDNGVKNNGDAWQVLGMVYFHKNKPNKAFKAFDEAIHCAIEDKKDEADVYLYLGIMRYINEKYDEAIADFDKAIAIKPDYAEAYRNLGHAYMAKKDLDQAIAAYTKALKYNPKDAWVKSSLASTYYIRGLMSNGNYSRAIKDYSKAIKNMPNYPLAFKKRYWANLKIGNYNQAIKGFKKLLKLNPDDAGLKQNLAIAYHDRAIAYDEKKDYAHAIPDFKRVLKFNPDDNTTRVLLEMAKKGRPTVKMRVLRIIKKVPGIMHIFDYFDRRERPAKEFVMSNPFDDTPYAELYGQVEEMMDKRYERTKRKVSNFSRKKGDVGHEISCTHCQNFHDIGIDVMNIVQCEDCLYQFQS